MLLCQLEGLTASATLRQHHENCRVVVDNALVVCWIVPASHQKHIGK